MKTYKKFAVFLFISLLFNNCTNSEYIPKELIDNVNPYIGNISHLLVPTFPTIHLPNSFIYH